MIGVDIPAEVEDKHQAVSFMCYHLAMAAAYFEASYSSVKEILDSIEAQSPAFQLNKYAKIGAYAFIEALERQYAADE